VNGGREAARFASQLCANVIQMTLIDAEFKDGVLNPAKPLALRSGEHVGVLIVRRPDPARWDLQRLADLSDEDVSLAESGLDDWAETLEREDRG
jgi:predicted DNA-binding antitoxin AbrB/MazE fold protein